ncbi:MAG: hypothetical protein KAT68_13170 [Bacteroidales bacterium]|nr:hypothetical protein [Bacteroidales bacterium]
MVKKFYYQIIIVLFILFSNNVNAQFEQKFTLNASLGYVYSTYYNYDWGMAIDGGIQHNINRSLSLTANIRLFPLYDTQHTEAYYYNTNIGVGAKFKFLSSKAINPFLFAEGNMNFVFYKYYENYDEPKYDPYLSVWSDGKYSSALNSVGPGFYGGMGINIKLNDNLGLFVQSGYYSSIYDEMMGLYSKAGLNISFLKSKSL